MFGRWLAVVAALGSAVGCSDLDPATETYATHYNLLPSRWRCLDQLGPSGMPEPEPAVPTFTAFVPDYRTYQPVDGLTARACLINDPGCPTGVSVGTLIPPPPDRPMTAGFTMPLSPAFAGFIRLEAPGYVTLDYYVNGPIKRNIRLTQDLSMVSTSSVIDFLNRIGADPAVSLQQGILAAQVFDCDNDRAPDVTLVLSGQQPGMQNVQPFAQQDRLPIANRPTDDEGIAGFINLPLVTISVEAEVNGRRFGSRSFSIQRGVLTSGTIRPYYDEFGY